MNEDVVDDEEESSSSNTIWFIVGGVAVLSVVGLIVALIIFFLKKRKEATKRKRSDKDLEGKCHKINILTHNKGYIRRIFYVYIFVLSRGTDPISRCPSRCPVKRHICPSTKR